MTRKDAGSRIIVALDVDNVIKATGLVTMLKGKVRGFKIGFEFILSVFTTLVTADYDDALTALEDLRDLFGELVGTDFMDCKLADIGNTVKGAATALTRLRPLMFNMHAFAGKAAMKAAREAIDTTAAKLDLQRKPLLLAVTLLTTLGEEDLVDLGLKPEGVEEPYRLKLVVRYAKLAQECGCDGVIASPLEVAAIREACGPDFLIYTPGVRLPGSAKQEQKAVATPGNSISGGANGIVVGRDITAAQDPLAAVELIIDNIIEACQD